jgi:hypothetical protein
MSQFIGIIVFVFASIALVGIALVFEKFIREHDDVIALAKRDRERQRASAAKGELDNLPGNAGENDHVEKHHD